MAYPIEQKKYWRCTVCNDIHFGKFPPSSCPTCKMDNVYVEIDANEARKVERFE